MNSRPALIAARSFGARRTQRYPPKPAASIVTSTVITRNAGGATADGLRSHADIVTKRVALTIATMTRSLSRTAAAIYRQGLYVTDSAPATSPLPRSTHHAGAHSPPADPGRCG